jgi:hypothetical protein
MSDDRPRGEANNATPNQRTQLVYAHLAPNNTCAAMSTGAKRATVVTVVAIALGAIAFTFIANASGRDLAGVRAATAKYQRVSVAQHHGWDLVEGLDHCFDNPGVGAMGYHYINVDLMDTDLDPNQPEALVYVPRPNGQLRLGAVEYIVPHEAWSEGNHADPPSVLGHDLHLNNDLGVWVLHAWIFENNPAGMFEDWNPKVSCPAS